MFRRILTLAALVTPLAGLGCATGGCGTGWSFQVGKPATVQAQTVLGPAVTTYAGQGIAAGPLAGDLATILRDITTAAPALLPMPSTARPVMGATSTSSCTMDEVCKKLDALISAVGRIPTARPMPQED